MNSPSPHYAFIRAVKTAAPVCGATRLVVWFGTGEIAARWETGQADDQVIIATETTATVR
jgi:hypothetical protein